MKIYSKQKFILTAAIAAVGVLAAGSAFGWLALHTGIILKNLEEVETKLAAMEYGRKNAYAIRNVLKEKRVITSRIRALFINRDRPIAFLDEITRLGKITGNNVVLDYSEQESDQESLAFRLTVEGAAENTLKYVKLLELMPFALSIESINWQAFSPADAAGNTRDGKLPDTRTLLTIRVKNEKSSP